MSTSESISMVFTGTNRLVVPRGFNASKSAVGQTGRITVSSINTTGIPDERCWVRWSWARERPRPLQFKVQEPTSLKDRVVNIIVPPTNPEPPGGPFDPTDYRKGLFYMPQITPLAVLEQVIQTAIKKFGLRGDASVTADVAKTSVNVIRFFPESLSVTCDDPGWALSSGQNKLDTYHEACAAGIISEFRIRNTANDSTAWENTILPLMQSQYRCPEFEVSTEEDWQGNVSYTVDTGPHWLMFERVPGVIGLRLRPPRRVFTAQQLFDAWNAELDSHTYFQNDYRFVWDQQRGTVEIVHPEDEPPRLQFGSVWMATMVGYENVVPQNIYRSVINRPGMTGVDVTLYTVPSVDGYSGGTLFRSKPSTEGLWGPIVDYNRTQTAYSHFTMLLPNGLISLRSFPFVYKLRSFLVNLMYYATVQSVEPAYPDNPYDLTARVSFIVPGSPASNWIFPGMLILVSNDTLVPGNRYLDMYTCYGRPSNLNFDNAFRGTQLRKQLEVSDRYYFMLENHGGPEHTNSAGVSSWNFSEGPYTPMPNMSGIVAELVVPPSGSAYVEMFDNSFETKHMPEIILQLVHARSGKPVAWEEIRVEQWTVNVSVSHDRKQYMQTLKSNLEADLGLARSVEVADTVVELAQPLRSRVKTKQRLLEPPRAEDGWKAAPIGGTGVVAHVPIPAAAKPADNGGDGQKPTSMRSRLVSQKDLQAVRQHEIGGGGGEEEDEQQQQQMYWSDEDQSWIPLILYEDYMPRPQAEPPTTTTASTQRKRKPTRTLRKQ